MDKNTSSAKSSGASSRPRLSSRVAAGATDVTEIGKDQLDAKLWPDASRYGRFGSFFQASNPELPWLTQYYINIGNGPGAKANSLAIPTTVPPTVEAIRKTAQFIWDRHHTDDGSWGALTLQDIKRELWAHARLEKLRKGVSRRADNIIQWANVAPQGNAAALFAGGVRAVANGAAGALGVSVTDVGHDDPKVKAYNLVDDWDKKEAEYMREGKYGRREDGSFKGDGWLGPLEITMPDGSKGVATEYSIGVDVDGKEMDIPSLVPTLTPQEIETMRNDIIPNRKQVPDGIAKKAVDFARDRVGRGQSVWAPDPAETRQASKGGVSRPSGKVLRIYKRLPVKDEVGAVQALTGLSREQAKEHRANVLKARGATEDRSLQTVGVSTPTEASRGDPALLAQTATRTDREIREQGVSVFVGPGNFRAAQKTARERGVPEPLPNGSGRSGAHTGGVGVAYVATPGAAREEIGHTLNAASDPKKVGSDSSQASSGRGDAIGYYGLGADNEVLNAMSMLKQAWTNKHKTVPTPLDGGDNNALLGFIGEATAALREGALGGDGDKAAQAVADTFQMLFDKVKSGKPMTANEHRVFEMMASKKTWDQLVRDDGAGNKTMEGAERREAMADAKGGEAGGDRGELTETPENVNSVPAADTPVANGPRIVINPRVFEDRRDALCVAMNEAYRVLMEAEGFDPVSEPTGEQRAFFADTAYAGDETQLRRTILARVCTFDTSVKDPTDGQIGEAVEFLDLVMEMGAPRNEWEQSVVQRTRDVLAAALGAGDVSRQGRTGRGPRTARPSP